MTGRFAPSPSGPLHFGSLVAAAGSWLSARRQGGRWLVRIEDLDTPRVVSGSEEEILETLRRYGLDWDEDPVRQSSRGALYERALENLRSVGAVFDCACSRAELERAASAPASSDPVEPGGAVYPGTCRSGIAAGRAPRAIRFRAPHEPIEFEDGIRGRVVESVARSVGDFVVKRADGPFAYQLAVVVDDADQGVTEVVRGGDLLGSTARQIAIQRALGLPAPRYVHLPLILAPDGSKLGKREGSLPLALLDGGRVRETLGRALAVLGIPDVAPATPARMLDRALERFDVSAIPAEHLAG